MIVNLIISLLLAITVSSCKTTSSSFQPKPIDFAQQRAAVLSGKYSLDSMTNHGPFNYRVETNYEIRLNASSTIMSDVAYAESHGKSPLVVLVHGNNSHKENHRRQIEHLASWGFHAMAIQLPNRHQWLENAALVQELISLLYVWPQLFASQIDVNQIILAGHSFGASAVSIAAARGAPVRALILLDPAVYHRDVVGELAHVNVPTMIIGADETVFRSKRRNLFFQRIPETVVEVSINKSTHNDAQWPSTNARRFLGFDPFTSRSRQEAFAAVMTLSAIGVTTQQQFDHAWQQLTPWRRSGSLTRLQRK